MAHKRLSNAEIRRFADAYNEHGTLRAAAKRLGISHGKASNTRYRRALAMGLIERPGRQGTRRTREELKPVVGGRAGVLPTLSMRTPAQGTVRRYIFTCAQNNTHLHRPAWDDLLTLARHYNARVMVSRFVYDKRSQAGMDKGEVLRSRRNQADASEVSWDPELTPYLSDERVIVAPGLVWCGEQNLSPTAVRPLSGLEAYTGRRSSIFPHVKLAMESVASGKSEGTKLVYTTGTVTQRNYIQRKAGLKAEFHHCYGGLLVEVDSDGDWFVRQLNCDGDGVMYDFGIKVDNGNITFAHRLEGVVWGDIHRRRIDPVVRRLAWGEGGMLDELKFKHQFMSDLLDFRSRIHHEQGNPHKLFEKYVDGEDDVRIEVHEALDFLAYETHRPWCQTVVVASNHDEALERWLREADYKKDPQNAVFFLETQLAKYHAIEQGRRDFLPLEWAAQQYGRGETARFLRADESYIICREAGGGIECGIHGHLGPNGSRGSALAFARMGRKAVVGHTHNAGIVDGVYIAGVSGLLDMGYNRGPSSWSQSHVIIYPNGKRAIVTMWNGKWRAG